MKSAAINLHHPFISGLHGILQDEFGCCLCRIIGVSDTYEKLAAVFILRHFYSYTRRSIAQSYTMNYHFIETVVDRMKDVYAGDADFRERVQRVLNRLDSYEEILEM